MKTAIKVVGHKMNTKNSAAFIYFYFIYACMHACMSLYESQVQVHEKVRDTKLLGPGVTVGCEQVCGCREQNQGSLAVLLDLSRLTSYGKKS